MSAVDLVFAPKRKEENTKYALNWCFKVLRREFKKTHRHSSVGDFYEFYFWNIARAFSIRFSDFYKPTFSKYSKNAQRSYNARYLKMLRLSHKFVEDCHLAFQRYYTVSQHELIMVKIDSIMDRLKVFVHQHAEKCSSFFICVSEFAMLMRYQFPWNFRQAEISRLAVVEVLQGGP